MKVQALHTSTSDDSFERRLQREIRQLRTAVRSLSEIALLSADDLRSLAVESPVLAESLNQIASQLESTSLMARQLHLHTLDRPDERRALLQRLRAGNGATRRLQRDASVPD